jgi:hypothetical protein
MTSNNHSASRRTVNCRELFPKGSGRTGVAQEAGFEIAVEPPLDGAWGDGQLGGDVLMRPAPVGQADDRKAVPERPVGRPEECLRECVNFGFGELDADHDDEGCRVREGSTLYTNQTASAGV